MQKHYNSVIKINNNIIFKELCIFNPDNYFNSTENQLITRNIKNKKLLEGYKKLVDYPNLNVDLPNDILLLNCVYMWILQCFINKKIIINKIKTSDLRPSIENL